MYGGDEVSAIVIDIGADTTKSGYAGEDTPKVVFPSSVGVVKGGEGGSGRQFYVDDLNFRRDNMDVLSPLTDGLVTDWDAYSNILEYTLNKRLRVQPSEHPLMIAEPSYNTRETRTKMVELLFEKCQPPALFLAKNPVLSSFASGRPTSLVIDIGHSGTVISPVHDGYALQKGIVRGALGGATLTDILHRAIEAGGTPVRPRFSFKRKQVDGVFAVTPVDCAATDSYRLFKQREIIADLKEAVCRVNDSPLNEKELITVPSAPYDLPDGNTLEVGVERYKVPELLFNPALLSALPVPPELAGKEAALKGLTAMANESINKCDIDLKKDFLLGVLVTGGTSLMTGLRERLEREMTEGCPASAKVKMVPTTSTLERKFSVWIGGSILASLGSMQQLWMSKAEYEEHGAQLIMKKAP